jgi:hypothetical protein
MILPKLTGVVCKVIDDVYKGKPVSNETAEEKIDE